MKLLIYKDHYTEYTYYLDEDGKKVFHGERKFWYDNGKLWALSYWCHGKCHGEYKKWTDDGDIQSHRFYINGEERPYVEMTKQEKLLFQIQHPGFKFLHDA